MNELELIEQEAFRLLDQPYPRGSRFFDARARQQNYGRLNDLINGRTQPRYPSERKFLELVKSIRPYTYPLPISMNQSYKRVQDEVYRTYPDARQEKIHMDDIKDLCKEYNYACAELPRDATGGAVRARPRILPIQYAPHQIFANNYVSPEMETKGIAFLAPPGTGKTCTAVAAMSRFMDTTDTPSEDDWSIVWVTTVQLRDRDKNVMKAMFVNLCLRQLMEAYEGNRNTELVRKIIEASRSQEHRARSSLRMPIARSELADGFEDLDKARRLMRKLSTTIVNGRRSFFDPKLNVISYNQLGNLLALGTRTNERNSTRILRGTLEQIRNPGPNHDPLRKVLFILDEAHYMYDDDQRGGDAIGAGVADKFAERIQASYRKSGKDSCKLILLTATPEANGAAKMIKMLNLLLPSEKQIPSPETWIARYPTPDTQSEKDAFGELTKGIISNLIGGDNDPRYFAMKNFQKAFYFDLSAAQARLVKRCSSKRIESSGRTKRLVRAACYQERSIRIQPRTRIETKEQLMELAPIFAEFDQQVASVLHDPARAYLNGKGACYLDVAASSSYGAKICKDALEATGYWQYRRYDSTQKKWVPEKNPSKRTFCYLRPKSTAAKDLTLQAFNDRQTNAQGQECQFVIYDRSYSVGINLCDIVAVWMLTVPLKRSTYQQALARSFRRCGQLDIHFSDDPVAPGRTVDIFMVVPLLDRDPLFLSKIREAIPQHVKEQELLLPRFLALIRNAAVDKKLNDTGNFDPYWVTNPIKAADELFYDKEYVPSDRPDPAVEVFDAERAQEREAQSDNVVVISDSEPEIVTISDSDDVQEIQDVQKRPRKRRRVEIEEPSERTEGRYVPMSIDDPKVYYSSQGPRIVS